MSHVNRHDAKTRELSMMRWGLVPAWIRKRTVFSTVDRIKRLGKSKALGCYILPPLGHPLRP
jgi:putative SOS response-associated peptidase YedK